MTVFCQGEQELRSRSHQARLSPTILRAKRCAFSESIDAVQHNMPARAIFFDFLGTCVNWHQSVIKALPASMPKMCALTLLFGGVNPVSVASLYDIDTTFYRFLLKTVDEPAYESFGHALELLVRPSSSLIQAWHDMAAWPDVPAAPKALRTAGLELFVLTCSSIL